LFVANLAFGETPVLETAKVGILAASVASGIAGVIVLWRKNEALPARVSLEGTRDSRRSGTGTKGP
jgi:hypothetical protein